ncbi:hypothetical protein MIND_00190300 [Mycena indigotica]|uniref:Uncharacterized protein n=1 Tax=Mycena indigotica TaxID=2126181 RepID=A0A8H6T669_9AGAR|nr:uncharacterized protein MIND_00190300 [Mycena indigotica]KAF7311798.1 hypothetical protein MIND_00190300 [Mycena indigotica]
MTSSQQTLTSVTPAPTPHPSAGPLCIECSWRANRAPTLHNGQCVECKRWFTTGMDPAMAAPVPATGVVPYNPWPTHAPYPPPPPPYPYQFMPIQPPAPPPIIRWKDPAIEATHTTVQPSRPRKRRRTAATTPAPAPSADSTSVPRSLPKPPPPCPYPIPDPRGRTKPVVVPYSTRDGPPPEPIRYQNLALLLKDLNRLLTTPHEGREFHFVGTYSIVAQVYRGERGRERQRGLLEDRLRSVAWEVLTSTGVVVNVPGLKIKYGDIDIPCAHTTAATMANWAHPNFPLTSDSSNVPSIPPCPRCYHTLSVRVTSLSDAELDAVPGWAAGRKAMLTRGEELTVGAERIELGLKHDPGQGA